MKRLLILIVMLLIGCSEHLYNDNIVVKKIVKDEYGFTAKYHFTTESIYSKATYYFIDTINAYNVGDTIFKSSLSK